MVTYIDLMILVTQPCDKLCQAMLLHEAMIITSIIACCSACWRVTKEYAIYPVLPSDQ